MVLFRVIFSHITVISCSSSSSRSALSPDSTSLIHYCRQSFIFFPPSALYAFIISSAFPVALPSPLLRSIVNLPLLLSPPISDPLSFYFSLLIRFTSGFPHHHRYFLPLPSFSSHLSLSQRAQPYLMTRNQ